MSDSRSAPGESPANNGASPELLTVPEAAERYRLHPDTLYNWCRKGAIPHLRVGPRKGAIRLRSRDLAREVTSADQKRGRR